MARTIDTVIRLNNEGEYQAALKRCNSTLGELKSELALTTSEFRNNANSMEALTAKGKTLSEMYDLQKAKIDTLEKGISASVATRDREQQTLADLREKYVEAQRTLASYGDEVDKNSEDYKKAKKEVDDLATSITAHEKSLNTAEKSIDTYSAQLNRAKIELNNMSDQIDANGRLLDEARYSADGCATSIDRYGNAVGNAGGKTDDATNAVDALASAMVASGINQSVGELRDLLLDCADAASTFETAIAKVYTLADESVVAKNTMKTSIMEMAAETGRGASDIAEAVYSALSAGQDTADALEFVRLSTQLSVAGFTSAATSVDVLTTILNAYQLSASETEAVASKLVKTQDLGKTTVDELGASMGKVIPTAKSYNVDLDAVCGSYAIMTKNGIATAETTTYLNSMLNELGKTGSTSATVLAETTGKTFAELMANGYSLTDVLEILADNASASKKSLADMFGSQEAAKAANLLKSNADELNQSIRVMASASGAVGENYSKMASTSEFASRRVEATTDNLKSAIGDQLNPVLNELKTAGADALTVATDFVAKRPAVVSAITGLVTTLSLLAGALAIAGTIKAVTTALGALNAVMLANPAVLITAGVVGLGAALVTFCAQADDASGRVDELTQASQALADATATSTATYNDTIAASEAACETVGRYCDRLDEIAATGLKTNEQQVQYATVLEQIKTVMPELNIEIDEQTGLLLKGTNALRQQAEQLQKTAKMEAIYARYKSDVAALAEAEYELAVNEKQLATTTETLTLARGEKAALDARQAELTAELTALADDASLTDEEYAKRLSALTAEQDALNAAQIEAVNTIDELESKESDLQVAVDSGRAVIEAQTPAVEAATEAYNDLGVQMDGTSAGFTAGVEKMADSAETSLKAVDEAYAKLYNSALDSLSKQISLLDKVEIKSKASASQMMENLASQKIAFENYADNITTAMERGVNQGLVQQLSDGSEESMAILQTLASATDEEIANLNAAWEGVGDAKETAATAMADVKSAITEEIQSLKDPVHEDGRIIGNQMVSGICLGMEEWTPKVESSAARVAEKALAKFAMVNEIHSPSKRWAALANYNMDGITQTYKARTADVEQASSQVAEKSYSAAVRTRQSSIARLASSTAQAPASAPATQIVPMLQQMLTALKAGQTLTIDGKTFVGATGRQRDQYMGQQRMLAERGAT